MSNLYKYGHQTFSTERIGCLACTSLRKWIVATITLAALLHGPDLYAVTLQQKVPAGSPLAQTVYFQYAIYYLPTSSKDPVSEARRLLRSNKTRFDYVDVIKSDPVQPTVALQLEMKVAKNYAPLGMDSLRYFGRGLSLEQAQALQTSKQALIMTFGHNSKDLWLVLKTANEAVEVIARNTSGLIWDEETREVFTPDEWHKRRVASWDETIPDVSKHTTIHVYQNGEYVRAITLGMIKFGLPDVVVEDFSWSQNNNMGNLINALCQAMAEGANFKKAGGYDLDIGAIRNTSARKQQNSDLLPNAKKIVHLNLLKGIREEGDPRNRLIELGFDLYPGKDVHAKQNSMLDSLYGWQDEIKRIKHNDELLAASRKARAKLPELRSSFQSGLQPGEFIEVKAPFDTQTGGQEWMWVEVTSWKGKKLNGLLKNEPFDIPSLHAGQIVQVNEDDIFDYIRRYANGKIEGNKTSEIIERMQGNTERTQ